MGPEPAEPMPTSMKRDGDALRIEWSDGTVGRVAWSVLRKQCPCATCNDERSKPVDRFKVLSDREATAGAPQPVSMKAVGSYAYQIAWNDGHSTGIYTVKALRTMCTDQVQHGSLDESK